MKLSDRIWQCENCGKINDRDENAALNIRDFGLETTFKNKTPEGIREEPVELSAKVEAVKQEKILV